MMAVVTNGSLGKLMPNIRSALGCEERNSGDEAGRFEHDGPSGIRCHDRCN